MQCVQASPTIRDCVFRNNKARQGGGLRLLCGSSPIIARCEFYSNTALAASGGQTNGGGLYMLFDCSPRIYNCTFRLNTAGHIGGGCAIQDGGAPDIVNCVFAGNTAGDYGGGMRSGFDAGPRLVNCTFVGNKADHGGGYSVAADTDGHVPPRSTSLENCILWDNDATVPTVPGYSDQIALFVTSSTATPQQLQVRECDVEGGQAAVEINVTTPPPPAQVLVWDTTNITTDPVFINGDGADNVYGTPDDVLRLGPSSLCIDNGDDTCIMAFDDEANLDDDTDFFEVIPVDVALLDRFEGGHVDMGAFEWTPCPADLDRDGDVDAADLGVLLGSWGQCFPPCAADLDFDGYVNATDMSILLGAWGVCDPGEFALAGSAEGGSEAESSASVNSPAELANVLGFASVDDLAAWLGSLDFETMSALLDVLHVGE